MKVKAAPGVSVPVEGKPHIYIEQSAVDVEETLYYRRRLADGDLIKIQPAARVAKNKNEVTA